VDEPQRGAVDTRAGARYASADLTVERETGGGRVFLRGLSFGERRKNGTPLQTNRTHVNQAVVGADLRGDRVGRLSLRLHASAQVYNQSFSAVAADRASEALTRAQRVPAQDAGLAAQWSHALGARHTLVTGTAVRQVRGSSDEVAYATGVATSAVGAGGRELTASAFVLDLLRLHPRVQVGLSARFDHWSRSRALSVTTPLSRPGASAVTTFADHDESSFNPRANLLVRATRRLDLSLAAYRSFRGPTLNELYRSFRVGDTVTQANPDLRAERLWGGETGARLRASRATLSATAFWTETKDPVANVTLSSTPSLITRKRQNLGRARARGVELDAETRLGERWRLQGGYAFTDGVVSSFPPARELQGKLLPQLPRHQASLRASYEGRRVGLGASVRIVGVQFEDDRNELPLASFAVFDLTAGVRVSPSLEAFVAAENLFDERHAVGLTPTPTIGPPLLVRVGLRLGLGDRARAVSDARP
jgi:outer membrane receptor protein involved in Fe transport